MEVSGFLLKKKLNCDNTYDIVSEPLNNSSDLKKFYGELSLFQLKYTKAYILVAVLGTSYPYYLSHHIYQYFYKVKSFLLYCGNLDII